MPEFFLSLYIPKKYLILSLNWYNINWWHFVNISLETTGKIEFGDSQYMIGDQGNALICWRL